MNRYIDAYDAQFLGIGVTFAGADVRPEILGKKSIENHSDKTVPRMVCMAKRFLSENRNRRRDLRLGRGWYIVARTGREGRDRTPEPVVDW